MYKTATQGSNVESMRRGVNAEPEFERASDTTTQVRAAKRFSLKIRTHVKAGGFEWG